MFVLISDNLSVSPGVALRTGFSIFVASSVFEDCCLLKLYVGCVGATGCVGCEKEVCCEAVVRVSPTRKNLKRSAYTCKKQSLILTTYSLDKPKNKDKLNINVLLEQQLVFS